MNILVTSHRFYPDFGGIEAMTQLLASEWSAAGHDVVVVTGSERPGDDFDAQQPFAVVRRPGPVQLLRLARACDVYFQNNISLKLLAPALLMRRPLVIAVRTWIARNDGSSGLRDRIKFWILKRARVISNSSAVAGHLPVSSTVIPNSYDDAVFAVTGTPLERSGEVAFVGRLVDSKGCDVLLHALALPRVRTLNLRLAVVGEGPERGPLERLAADLGISDSVQFLGRKTPHEVNSVLNHAAILVVPSRWAEPFGIVALEGLAAGCVVVATEMGGLPDAVGPGGLLVPNGDVDALADCLVRLAQDGELWQQLRTMGESHAQAHTASAMAERYMEVLVEAMGRAAR